MTTHLFLDTNILVYSRDEASDFFGSVRDALQGLTIAGVDLCIHRQILREYVAVVTRVRPRGLGATIEKALSDVAEFESFYRILGDPESAWENWKQVLRAVGITGLRIHDAYLTAVMKGHGISTILTVNTKDFEGMFGIRAVEPQNWRELVEVDTEEE